MRIAMTSLKPFAGTVLIAISASCAYNPPAVAVEGLAADLEQLAGEWKGEYTDGPSGRRGNVWFKLVAGEDHSHGDLLMIPEGSGRPYQPYSREEHGPADRVFERAPRVLTIRFVRTGAGAVSGTLDPYWDPDRHCQASTVFRGSLRVGIIEGMFSSICEGGAGQTTGRWKVTRKG
jgi:hypothetical protein